MIRPMELASVLETIRATIATELKADLSSAAGRAGADALVMILDRLLTDITLGDDVARQQRLRWDHLAAELATLGLRSPQTLAAPGGGFLGDLDALQKLLDSLQQDIASQEGFTSLHEKLKHNDPQVRAWFDKATNALVELSRNNRTVLSQQNEAVAKTQTVDRAAALRDGLGHYLARRYPELGSDPIQEFRLTPGGYAKQTGLFSLHSNASLPEKLVLRLDMPNSVTGTSVEDEYPVIERMYGLGLPVPRPVLLETDNSVLGGAFMLMTEVENAEPSGPYFPVERKGELKTGPDFGREVARTLARLHASTREDSASAPDYHKQVHDAHMRWRTLPKGPYSLVADLGYAWLLSHPVSETRPWCAIHGDFGAHNILVRDGHLAGLIDWELSRIGDPAEDLAQCRMMLLPGIMAWEDFVAEYLAAGGDPAACDEATVGYFCIWVFLHHLQNHIMLREKYLAGERTDVLAANIITYYYALVAEYLAEALKIAVDAHRVE
ncbi:MAG: phosphotransferase family protein [Porticoccaceae bacterium]